MRVIYCALFCLLAPAATVVAQEVDDMPPPPPPPPPPAQCGPQHGFHHREHPGFDGPRRDIMKCMQEDLGLTDEQVTAMKELHKKYATERHEAVKAAMEATRAKEDAELKKILSEEQFQKLTDKRAEMQEKMKDRFDRRGHGEGPRGCPPPCDMPQEEE